MRLYNLDLLGDQLRAFVKTATPPPAIFGPVRTMTAARELGLWIARSADDSQVVIHNYTIPMITPSSHLVNRRLVEGCLRHPLPFDKEAFALTRIGPQGIWLKPIPVINVKEGLLSFETEIRGFYSSESSRNPRKYSTPREEVALLLGTWLGGFDQEVVFPEPVVEVWKDRRTLKSVLPGDCGPLGEIDKVYFASEVPVDTPQVALNYLGLER